MKFLNEEESISKILLKKLNESKDLKEDAWDDNFTINMIDKDKVYWKRKSDGKEIITSLDIFSKPTDPTEWKSEEELNQYTLTEAEDIKNSNNETNIIKALQDIAMNYEDAGSDIEAVLTDLYKANCFNIDNLMNYIKEIKDYMNENLSESIDTSEYTHKDSKFKYMLLDRLKQDCEYFLGSGNGAEKHLWAGNIDDQIKLMKDLYNSFSDNQKPEWIFIKDIDNYEKQMKSYNKKKVNTTNLNEDSYESGIFYEIEEALREAGLNPARFNENGIMTNNIGWTVTGEDGTEQQITCDGSYLDDEEDEEINQ